MFEELLEKEGFWSKVGPFSDVVLSSRVRLARNISNIYFPSHQSENDVGIVRSLAKKFANESTYNGSIYILNLNDINRDDKRFLRERNIITYKMELLNNRLIIVENNEKFSIMINEEDHFRIQIIKPGFQLMEAYQLADRVDDELNRFVSYAYSEKFGYLTSSPINCGTGLRLSVTLHLPILSILKIMPDVIKVTKENGAMIGGIIGEGIKSIGSIFQLSNHMTIYRTEVDVIEEIDQMTSIIVEMESEARDEYLSENEHQLMDIIWRSYGILKYSRNMGYAEAMNHLSNFRLGIILSIIKDVDLNRINDIMINIQWSHLEKIAAQKFEDSLECDYFRSFYLRMQLD